MNIVFATNNKNKVKEIQTLLPKKISILSLKDINCFDDIPETKDTLEGNSEQKADYVKNNFGNDCFADDTGLFIESLNGEPGVYSARYAGEDGNAKANIKKVLSKIDGIDNRKAYFKTIICLILNNEKHYFEGRVDGKIISTEKGVDGFGYDPIFVPDDYETSFAEMPLSEKNKISHRARAVKKLIAFLELV